jgi:hypothetical protein
MKSINLSKLLNNEDLPVIICIDGKEMLVTGTWIRRRGKNKDVIELAYKERAEQ